ncbi:MAG: helix-turn-helix domain-containing protein [Myxococcota bacterium]
MSKRRYHQYCGVARALDVLGERWTLLIVRDLLLGPRRYSDLLTSLEGITTNLLAARLRHLVDQELVQRVDAPAPSGATPYALTQRGAELKPVVLALGSFGAQYLQTPDPQDRFSPRWAMVSLMRRYRGCPRPAILQLHIGDDSFVATMTPDALTMRDGLTDAADTTLHGSAAAWMQWVSGRFSAKALVREGDLVREGPARPFTDLTRAVGSMP